MLQNNYCTLLVDSAPFLIYADFKCIKLVIRFLPVAPRSRLVPSSGKFKKDMQT